MSSKTALGESELLSLLQESLTDTACFTIDSSGKIQSWNAGVQKVLGYEQKSFVDKSLQDLLASATEGKDSQEGLAKGLIGLQALPAQWFVRQDGSQLWGELLLKPIGESQTSQKGFAVILRDKTKEKQQAEELANQHQETERLRRLYEASVSNTPDLIYVFGLDHRFKYANQGLLKMWGKTWEEAIGKNCLELGYADWHAAMHGREIDQVVATKQPIKGEVPFTGTFGRRIYEYIFVPVFAENGEVEAVAGTTRDVTDRHEAEAALQESEGRFRGLLEQAPFSIQVFDREGRTQRVNKAWEKLWGLSPEQMAHYNILEDQQLEAKGILPQLRRAFAGEVVHLPAVQLNANDHVQGGSWREDPVRWVSVIAYPFKDESGEVREVVLVHEDITAQRQAEEERIQSEQRMRTVLESISDAFIAVDSDWKYTYVNPQGERLLNRQPGGE